MNLSGLLKQETVTLSNGDEIQIKELSHVGFMKFQKAITDEDPLAGPIVISLGVPDLGTPEEIGESMPVELVTEICTAIWKLSGLEDDEDELKNSESTQTEDSVSH